MYKATGDHYYLQVSLILSLDSGKLIISVHTHTHTQVAKKALKALQKHARVECGFAAVNDLRTGKHEDRMDSFVLSETIKYLFLIFADPSELILDLDNFIFTTEAHLLPLSLGQLTNVTTGKRTTRYLKKKIKNKNVHQTLKIWTTTMKWTTCDRVRVLKSYFQSRLDARYAISSQAFAHAYPIPNDSEQLNFK